MYRTTKREVTGLHSDYFDGYEIYHNFPMGRILGPQDLSSVENMNDAQPTKMGKLRKILSGLSDIDSLVNIE